MSSATLPLMHCNDFVPSFSLPSAAAEHGSTGAITEKIQQFVPFWKPMILYIIVMIQKFQFNVSEWLLKD